MTTRYAIKFSIWIGIAAGLFTLAFTASPLNEYNVLPAAFVSLAVFFITGTKNSEILDFCTSSVAGVAWGLVYLYLIGTLIAQGLSVPLANGLVILVANSVLCAFHFIVTKKYVFSKIPMIFCAFSCTFYVGAGYWLPLMISLVLGVLLAVVCQSGTLFLDEAGRWKLPGKAEPMVGSASSELN